MSVPAAFRAARSESVSSEPIWLPVSVAQAASAARSRPGGAAQPVAVGVGGQDQVGADLLAARDHGVENGGVLRVGDVLGHVGEIGVGRGVRAENLHVAESGRRQHRANRRCAHAVQRRIDDLQLARARACSA